MTSMTYSDPKVMRGQTPPGGFFELFYPKWGWENGAASCGPPYRTIFAFFALFRRKLNSMWLRLVFTKIKFADFEL